MSTHTRRLKFSRWGLAENPIGQHVLMPDGSLREVYDTYRREVPSCIMLKVRSFNREILEEIAAGSAMVLDRSWKTPGEVLGESIERMVGAPKEDS